jgi:hypothetical protein
VKASKDFVRLVDHREIKRGDGGKRRCAALAPRILAANQIYARCQEGLVALTRLNPKEVQQFALPLADERLGHDQQNTLHTLGTALRNDQAGLDCLSQANLICQNAAAFPQPAKCKNHRVDLMRVRINSA